jgi:hypothetical protein
LDRTSKRHAIWGAVGFAVAASTAALGLSSYQGCTVYDSSLIGSPDGTSPAGDDAGVPFCMHAYPPDRPIADDADDTTSVQLVAAFNSIDIGVEGGAYAAIPPFGFDLDHTCTCPGPPSCAPRKGAQRGQNCDDEAGRDNIDIQLFRLLQGAAAAGTIQIDQGLTAGQYSVLLEISNYNGKANDPSVTVKYFVSNGLNRDADGGIPVPKFDGTDRWTIDPSSLQGQGFYADNAYVANFNLVANMAVPIPIAFGARSFLGGATMELAGAVIVGQLELRPIGDSSSDLGVALLGGTIAGRWPTSQLLSTLANIPQEGGFLCGTDPSAYLQGVYGLFKRIACLAADITTVQSLDNNSPLAPCDAISVGMQFTAVPALLGDTLGVPPPPAGCQNGDASWSDQCPP